MLGFLCEGLVDGVAGGIVYRLNLALFRRRARQRAPLVGGAYALRRGRTGGVRGLVVLGLSAAICLGALASNGFRLTHDVIQAIALCACLAFIAGLFVVGSFATGYRLDGEGVEHRILWWRKRFRWAEIQRVDAGFVPYEFVVRSAGGGSIILSFLMVGSGTFAQQILLRIPQATLAANPRSFADLSRIRDGCVP